MPSDGSGAVIQTVLGKVPVTTLGLILPHEHLFTDLRGPDTPGYARGDPQRVLQVMKPYLDEAYAAGVTALVECSTIGVGRNVTVLQRLAEATPVHIVAPTGVYREAYIPSTLRESSLEELAEAWIADLTVGMDGGEVRAGFIKIAVSDDGPTQLEVRNIRAAARASLATGAVIASHTIASESARREMDLLEEEGLDLSRFIWVHANAAASSREHIQAARRGAYVEFDAVGMLTVDQQLLVRYTLDLAEAGFSERILLSHDAGWYDPGGPDGQPAEGGVRGFVALVREFIPALSLQGASPELIRTITHINPARAFAMAGD